ncbi:prepilin peptidase [Actinoplanes sp. TRM 88003]|uniref:Prepilin peptidase n=1 Tax=Paractinoplanes aksuensis TaxID=2939490 RepID=A0ABT1DWQ7_9ACTN|nr:prepilin peptidase [Actinoplanes aksuensis]MCO8275298.1 prepilin peptidase [Actinoplanes aksuensis]
MSVPLVILAAVFGGSATAFLPRLARQWAAPAHDRRFVYAMTTLSGAAASTLLAATLGPSPLLPVLLLAVVPGLLLALIDLRCLRLPDRVVGALAIVPVPPLAVLRPERLGSALLGGALVLTTYLVIALLPGRGLGLGDVKLAAVLATILGFLGWPAVLAGLVVPHLINGPIALALLLARRGRPLPFGPALLAGALIAVTAV